MPEVETRATEYTVSVVPETVPDYYLFQITVAYRGRGLWAVSRMRWCLDADGDWDFEPSPSSRDDDWLETHRFDLDTALRLAAEQAPLVKVNGVTALQVADRVAAGSGDGSADRPTPGEAPAATPTNETGGDR